MEEEGRERKRLEGSHCELLFSLAAQMMPEDPLFSRLSGNLLDEESFERSRISFDEDLALLGLEEIPSRLVKELWEERNWVILCNAFCDDFDHWMRQEFRDVAGSNDLPPIDWIHIRVHQMKNGVVWRGPRYWQEHEGFLRQEIWAEEDDLWDNWEY